jgi:hypothetical protein
LDTTLTRWLRFTSPLVALLATPAAAQFTATLPATCRADGSGCVTAITVVNPDGTRIAGGTGTGGGGDASASNQNLQLTQEQLIAARLGDTASPATGSVNARLALINTTLGTPLQAGGSISNITGTISLPTGAATATNQTTMLAKMPALGTAGTSSTDVISVQGIANGTAQNVTTRGGGSLATGQVSVATTSTLLVAARALRQRVTVSVGAANTCAFGNTGVTTTTGFPLQPVAGATITLETNAALYAVCSATTTVSYVEQF